MKNSQEQVPALTAETIVNNFILATNLSQMREELSQMFIAFLLHDDGLSDLKHNVHATYESLNYFLKDAEKLKKSQPSQDLEAA